MTRRTPEFTPTSLIKVTVDVPFRIPDLSLDPSGFSRIRSWKGQTSENHPLRVTGIPDVTKGNLRIHRNLVRTGEQIFRMHSDPKYTPRFETPLGGWNASLRIEDSQIKVLEDTLPREVAFTFKLKKPERAATIGLAMIFTADIPLYPQLKESLIIAESVYRNKQDTDYSVQGEELTFDPFGDPMFVRRPVVFFPPEEQYTDRLRYPWWVIYEGELPSLESLYDQIYAIDSLERKERAAEIMKSIRVAAASTNKSAPEDLSENY